MRRWWIAVAVALLVSGCTVVVQVPSSPSAAPSTAASAQTTTPRTSPSGTTAATRQPVPASEAPNPDVRVVTVSGDAAFSSPSGMIHCYLSGSVRCDFMGDAQWKLPKPAGCDLDWGDSVVLSPDGEASVTCHGDTVAGTAVVGSDLTRWYVAGTDVTVPFNGLTLAGLAYGSMLTNGPVSCLMETTGLTCTNLAGHGFFMSKESARLT